MVMAWPADKGGGGGGIADFLFFCANELKLAKANKTSKIDFKIRMEIVFIFLVKLRKNYATMQLKLSLTNF